MILPKKPFGGIAGDHYVRYVASIALMRAGSVGAPAPFAPSRAGHAAGRPLGTTIIISPAGPRGAARLNLIRGSGASMEVRTRPR